MRCFVTRLSPVDCGMNSFETEFKPAPGGKHGGEGMDEFDW